MAVACLAVLAALIAGCGSSGSSSTSADTAGATASETTASSSASSGPLTKDEFVKQANQICKVGLKQKDENVTAGLKEISPKSPSGASQKALGTLVSEAVLPPYSETIEQLGELSAPKGDEAEVDLIVQKYETAMKAAEADPASAVEKNPFQTGDKAAEGYGITSCIL